MPLTLYSVLRSYFAVLSASCSVDLYNTKIIQKWGHQTK